MEGSKLKVLQRWFSRCCFPGESFHSETIDANDSSTLPSTAMMPNSSPKPATTIRSVWLFLPFVPNSTSRSKKPSMSSAPAYSGAVSSTARTVVGKSFSAPAQETASSWAEYPARQCASCLARWGITSSAVVSGTCRRRIKMASGAKAQVLRLCMAGKKPRPFKAIARW